MTRVILAGGSMAAQMVSIFTTYFEGQRTGKRGLNRKTLRHKDNEEGRHQ